MQTAEFRSSAVVRSILSSFLCCVLTVAALSACSKGPADTAEAPRAASLIPAPREIRHDSGAFELTAATSVRFDAQAAPAAAYFIDLMQRTRGLTLGRADDQSAANAAEASQIEFRFLAGESAFNVEGYSLNVSPRRIVVSASDSRGLFYGAVTLWQLATSSPEANIRIPTLAIEDSPRFRWRGFMLDSARHYQSPAFIRKLIDAMALHKLNVLHWHLIDDQAWRLEIRKYPKLTSIGAWRVPAGPAAAADIDPAAGKPRLHGGFYSQDEVRELVAYARERHITIVPEIEMPGHASAAIAAYPELGVEGATRLTSDGVHPPSDWGVYPAVFDIDDAAFNFLEDVLSETLELFPSEYIHVGGDEAVKDQWRASQAVQERMRKLGLKDEHALQSWFIQRIEKFLNARGRRLIGWDEILEGGLAPNATVMSWRGIDGAIAAAQAGRDTVLSPNPVLYFDNRPVNAVRPPGRGRVVSIEDVYRFDPAPAALTDAQRQHILGVQANIWTEHIRTEERVEYMTFPRLAALAEVAWSPSERIDWDSFKARLPSQRERYARLGLATSPEAASETRSDSRFASQDLKLCTEHIPLSLEDDAPLQGERAVFLVDILNPCWIARAVDLSKGLTLTASVGQAPFNFQVGEDVKKIPLHAPSTAEGEFEVRLGNCDGEHIASLPLAPAAKNFATTQLPSVMVKPREGAHDLCLRFTRRSVDPIWAIEWIEVMPGAALSPPLPNPLPREERG